MVKLLTRTDCNNTAICKTCVPLGLWYGLTNAQNAAWLIPICENVWLMWCDSFADVSCRFLVDFRRTSVVYRSVAFQRRATLDLIHQRFVTYPRVGLQNIGEQCYTTSQSRRGTLIISLQSIGKKWGSWTYCLVY